VVGGKKARRDGGEGAEELRLETAERGPLIGPAKGIFADSATELQRSSLAITPLDSPHVHPGSPKASGRRRRPGAAAPSH
jgi:hypothetical protein